MFIAEPLHIWCDMSIIYYNRPGAKAALMRGESVPWIDNNKRARYIRQAVLSFPPWVDRKVLRMMWMQCRAMEIETGVPHSLDHIIPLNHPYVCGLTVPWNLRCIPHLPNCSKGNSWHPDQSAIEFAERMPEQLSLEL
jgi:hypothetical protein